MVERDATRKKTKEGMTEVGWPMNIDSIMIWIFLSSSGFVLISKMRSGNVSEIKSREFLVLLLWYGISLSRIIFKRMPLFQSVSCRAPWVSHTRPTNTWELVLLKTVSGGQTGRSLARCARIIWLIWICFICTVSRKPHRHLQSANSSIIEKLLLFHFGFCEW